ncbi:hypothetical protein HAP48_0004600 [Bradyrhizobium septentrionale]|uniref:Uncharacterized protein n=1 Tax=Bradyrhizobium septentrionale TaxID=1404411 RepID=A0A973W5W9_9BRAD|nr:MULTISPECIES: hypothetical protein [Bradyrhizobium]UGY16817.1 hypothetical protein HAP48_0004600 [Bradyrhizobium septentrionale]UGY25417.1 hypothetical protein HU675_0000145 [Bradyrhizobium septentrionale]
MPSNDPYVYLSDGGHFENLGAYEMIRRRCKFILISDAACDPDFGYEDLGNLVRRVSISASASSSGRRWTRALESLALQGQEIERARA